MRYLTGATNDEDEPLLAAAGIGLMVQPGNSYHRRVGRYPFWAADNGRFQPRTYVGDEAWLDWLDRLPRAGCLFAVVPDVARRPDGSLGGDPAATWATFEALAPVVQDLGFPAALAAQDGMEALDVARQLDACDCLFIAGSDDWKVGDAAAGLVRRARNAGKWVHMGRVNSMERIARARAMGCNSADGTFIKYRRRSRARDNGDEKANRGVAEVAAWLTKLEQTPILFSYEAPSNPLHKAMA